MSVNNSQIGGNVITRLNEAPPFPPPVFCFLFFVDVLNGKEGRKKSSFVLNKEQKMRNNCINLDDCQTEPYYSLWPRK